MAHFGDKSNVVCSRTCDNCTKPAPLLKEYTNEAIMICKCIEEMKPVQPLISIRQLALLGAQSRNETSKAKDFTLLNTTVQADLHFRTMLRQLPSSTIY